MADPAIAIGDERTRPCECCEAIADLVEAFVVGDRPQAVDEAFLWESGIDGPLITYGMMRRLQRAFTAGQKRVP